MKETISRYFLGHANDFTVRGCEFEIETTVGDGVCGGGVRGCECESESTGEDGVCGDGVRGCECESENTGGDGVCVGVV